MTNVLNALERADSLCSGTTWCALSNKQFYLVHPVMGLVIYHIERFICLDGRGSWSMTVKPTCRTGYSLQTYISVVTEKVVIIIFIIVSTNVVTSN